MPIPAETGCGLGPSAEQEAALGQGCLRSCSSLIILLGLSALPPPLHSQDEKYWSRRYKNNEAAKRSRDARRLKENQISVRAAFLEKENALLRQEVVSVRQELSHYRAVLSRYQAQHGAL